MTAKELAENIGNIDQRLVESAERTPNYGRRKRKSRHPPDAGPGGGGCSDDGQLRRRGPVRGPGGLRPSPSRGRG